MSKAIGIRLIALVLYLVVPAALLTATAGCDDHKKVKKTETVQESEPQMVSPGEEVVE